MQTIIVKLNRAEMENPDLAYLQECGNRLSGSSKCFKEKKITGNDLSKCAEIYIGEEESADIDKCRRVYPPQNNFPESNFV